MSHAEGSTEPGLPRPGTRPRDAVALQRADEPHAEDLLVLQRDLAVCLAGVTSITEGMQRALELLVEREGLTSGTAYTVDPVSGGTDLVAHVNIDPEVIPAIAHYDADTPETARVVAGVPAYGTVAEWEPEPQELAERQRLRSYALLPVLHEGRATAAFIVGSTSADGFDLPLRHVLEAAAAQLGTALDRIRAAARLREAEMRYRLLLNDIGEGAGVVDEDERFVSANAAAHAIFGVEPGTLIGRSLAEFTAPETLALIREQTSERRRGTRSVYEHEVTRPDGEHRTLVVIATPSFREDGSFAGSVAVFSDVTDQRRAEAELRRSEGDLRRAQAIAHIGSWTWDAPGTWRWSEEMYRIHGYEPGSADAQADRGGFAGLIAPEDRERIAAIVLDRTRPPFVELEYRIVRPDGEERIVLSRIETTLDAEGNLLRIVGTTQDVTERRRAAAERRALETQVQQAQKLESLGVLAGGIAHDFNNLLVAILGNAGLALTEIPAGSPASDTVHEIETAALRAADLAGQMLAYSGRGRFVIEQLDLNAVVSEMGRLLAASVVKRAVIRYELAREPVIVEGDATQLRQVILNLITNASDAIGGADGVITLRTAVTAIAEAPPSDAAGLAVAPGTYAVLSVSDTGAGMDADTRARIFDPFFTTKSTGRGLGLAAVLGIVRGHHGGMLVESAPGEGSTFTVLLPALAPAAEPAGVSAGREDEGARPRSGGRVLVVDDEPSVRAVAARILARAGYEVRQAADGEEAVMLVTAEPDAVDAVLLDLSMPRLGGEGTYRALHEVRPDLPVVLTSGYDENASVAPFAGPGLAGFIGKPYRPQALVEAIASAIARSAKPPDGPAGTAPSVAPLPGRVL